MSATTEVDAIHQTDSTHIGNQWEGGAEPLIFLLFLDNDEEPLYHSHRLTVDGVPACLDAATRFPSSRSGVTNFAESPP